jgi:ribosome-dependent ATPase
MSVLVATAYMEEAERFDWLVAMDAGRVLATGTRPNSRRAPERPPGEAFIALLPEASRAAIARCVSRRAVAERRAGIEAAGSPRASAISSPSTASASRIERGEIFGFVGSNGCGKTHDHEDADRAAAAERGGGAAASASRSSAHDSARAARRLHVAVLLALYAS